MKSDDATNQIVEAKLRQVSEFYQAILRLSHYEITHHYVDTTDPEDPGSTADTDTQWNYLRADITWWLPNLVGLDDRELDDIALHEHVHVLLAPEQAGLAKRWDDQMELTTESVTRALRSCLAHSDASSS